MYGNIPFPGKNAENNDRFVMIGPPKPDQLFVPQKHSDVPVKPDASFSMPQVRIKPMKKSRREQKIIEHEIEELSFSRSELGGVKERRNKHEDRPDEARSSLTSLNVESFKLKTKYKDLDLGENFSQAQGSLEQLKSKIKNLKALARQPDSYITDHFNVLKKQVEEERDLYRKEVDYRFKQLINEVKDIEASCKALAKDQYYDRELHMFEDNFKKLKSDMDTLKIDIKVWDNVTLEADSHTSKINRLVEDLKSELMHDKYYSVETNITALTKDLEQIKIVPKNRQKMENNVNVTLLKKPQGIPQYGSFHFSKHGFKNFAETLKSTFHSGSYTFNGCKWFVELVNENGYHMSCFLHRTHGTSNKPLNTIVRAQLNNKKDGSRNMVKKFDARFDLKNFKGGYDDFASFQDIYDRGFYDEENDMIDFSFYIQVKD